MVTLGDTTMIRTLALTMLVTACGADTGDDKPAKTTVQPTSLALAKLPDCTEDRLNQLVYQTTDKTFYTCLASGWSVVDINGKPGKAGKNGTDGQSGDSLDIAETITYSGISADLCDSQASDDCYFTEFKVLRLTSGLLYVYWSWYHTTPVDDTDTTGYSIITDTIAEQALDDLVYHGGVNKPATVTVSADLQTVTVMHDTDADGVGDATIATYTP